MKKIVKGMMLLSVGMLFVGCSCNKNKNNDSPTIQPPVAEENKVLDLSTDRVNLYEQSVKSVVKVDNENEIGTGVVYKKESGFAYIITNAHVILDDNGNEYHDNVKITFHDYSIAKASYIGMDKTRDVALFYVKDTTSCEVAKIVAYDTDVKVGESVYAIGHPYGQMFAMTEGTLTTNRFKTAIPGGVEVYIYNATATINSGNSGGPLFNSKGEVIAINTMHPKSSEIKNFNYSIPINYFIKIANHIAKNNKTRYIDPSIAFEGISVCDFSIENLTTKGITAKNGVYITAAEEIGLTPGRIITKINGAVIETYSDYEFELNKYNIGETITVTTVDIAGINEKAVNIVLK